MALHDLKIVCLTSPLNLCNMLSLLSHLLHARRSENSTPGSPCFTLRFTLLVLGSQNFLVYLRTYHYYLAAYQDNIILLVIIVIAYC